MKMLCKFCHVIKMSIFFKCKSKQKQYMQLNQDQVKQVQKKGNINFQLYLKSNIAGGIFFFSNIIWFQPIHYNIIFNQLKHMKFGLLLISFGLLSFGVETGAPVHSENVKRWQQSSEYTNWGKEGRRSRRESSGQKSYRKRQVSAQKPHKRQGSGQESRDNEYWEKNPYCASWKGFKCVKCAYKTFWNGKTCVLSNPNCKTFNQKEGCCTSCFGGYQLANGKCVVAEPKVIDPLCREFKDGRCVQCATRAYFSKDGSCINADPLCKTFSKADGCCTSCYAGFDLKNGKCVVDKDYKGRKESGERRRSGSNERKRSGSNERRGSYEGRRWGHNNGKYNNGKHNKKW